MQTLQQPHVKPSIPVLVRSPELTPFLLLHQSLAAESGWLRLWPIGPRIESFMIENFENMQYITQYIYIHIYIYNSLLFTRRRHKEALQQPAAVPSEIGEMEVLSTPRGTMIAGSVPLRHGLQLHELDASADASVQEPWQIEDKNRQRELRFPCGLY